MYAKALELSIAQFRLENSNMPIGKYTTTDGRNLIKEGETEPSLIVDYNGDIVFETIHIFDGNEYYLLDCKVNNVEYDYKYGTLTKPVSFEQDSWDIIAKNVRVGNVEVYKQNLEEKVHNTKEIEMDIDKNGIMESYTVRIANTSIPEECNSVGFSETACGFVIEFEDLITSHSMNSTGTNAQGWPASGMREYIGGYVDEKGNFVEGTIYKLLPEDLKKVLIDTYVVSGYGSDDSANFESIDKLFLLSVKEVINSTSSDTSASQTRQLDYYSVNNITNFHQATKYFINGSYTYWWLRSAIEGYNNYFWYVANGGGMSEHIASASRGVSPAFRIG